MRDRLIELFYDNNVHCEQKIEGLVDDVMDTIAHGVTVQERLIAKQVVIDKKYGSVRCPSCNAVLGASSHYCWQCGQKVTHKLPQPPKGE